MSLRDAYGALSSEYGPQGWWPADTDVEVVVGAVLVQNTAWTNVEKVTAVLREHGLLDLDKLAALPEEQLGELIRPAGTFRVKARRLQAVARFVRESGGLEALAEQPTEALRWRLLAVHGVGPETCDAILCYALDRPAFVVDAYARRLYRRLGLIDGGEDYEALRAMTERALGSDANTLGEWHALVVEHGKRACRPRPVCGACPLAQRCPRVGVNLQAS